ncbi:MAG: extracellular solute-binding protein, partial [Actinomycetota bacterium]|nr:extracellular solute-binding protein [Actinomycetota bacterium]
MMSTRTRRGRRVAAIVMSLAFVAAACGDDDNNGGAADTTTAPDVTGGTEETTPPSDEPVTIDWWHIQNNDPGLANWQAMADAYTAEHPNVTINITVMENEAFKAAIQTNIQSGDVPDLFQSWGGGGLRDQVAAGVVRDITDESASFVGDLGEGAVKLYQVDDKQYGIPFNAGMVGFWYNKDLFAEAGIDAPPATWDELLVDIQKLKDAGITPIAVGAGDKWPAHFWYSYLMLRLGGADAMNQIAADNNFSVPNVVGAGELLADLVAMEPFQEGFLGAGWDAPDGESGTMATGAAAMDLMGQWAPGAFKNQAGLQPEEDLPFELGWFPFPSVDGGDGLATDAFGGADGFAVGKDAPPEAVDFLKFITNADNQRIWAQNSGLPVNKEAADAVTDPNMQAVLDGLNAATFTQLFLDQFFTAEVGAAVNDQTALLFAGATSPQDAADAITAVAGG